MLLTEQEIYEMADDGVFIGNVKEITRAIESAVIAKIKAHGPVAWLSVDCIGERYLCFSKPQDSDKVSELYQLPKGEKDDLL